MASFHLPQFSLADFESSAGLASISSRCQEFGAFYIRVSDPFLSDAVRARNSSISLFNRPLDEKLVSLRPSGVYRGYLPLDDFADDEGSAPAVRYEGFVVGDDGIEYDQDPSDGALRLVHPNVWPIDFLEQKEAMLNYWRNCQSASVGIIDALMSGVGVKVADILHAYEEPLSNLVFMRYQPSDQFDVMLPKSHTDSSMITLLFFDGVPGLEVHVGSEWVQLPCYRDTFLCLISDSLEALSGGRYKAVRHRVRSPANEFRHTMAFFSMPNKNFPVSPLVGETCSKYFFTAGEKFRSYLSELN